MAQDELEPLEKRGKWHPWTARLVAPHSRPVESQTDMLSLELKHLKNALMCSQRLSSEDSFLLLGFPSQQKTQSPVTTSVGEAVLNAKSNILSFHSCQSALFSPEAWFQFFEENKRLFISPILHFFLLISGGRLGGGTASSHPGFGNP